MSLKLHLLTNEAIEEIPEKNLKVIDWSKINMTLTFQRTRAKSK
ncbi:MAG: hypothetical protein CM1200mP13_07940 [Candidatus Pelagibacterales bacterium]|nr:MAG: hypothetical protein CM1200mP13_07940 [Pelagibacterales bacterium]